jgi:hypothetical protein
MPELYPAGTFLVEKVDQLSIFRRKGIKKKKEFESFTDRAMVLLPSQWLNSVISSASAQKKATANLQTQKLEVVI